ncbi:MAG: SHOCT domain-containing protein [Holophagaceae bacterium]
MRALSCLLLAAALPAPAQFWSRLANPSVEVILRHAPDLGVRLDRVAFAPPRNAPSRELGDALLAALVRGGVMVVDRARTGTEAPSHLLEVDVSRDEVRHEESKKEDKDRDGRARATTHTWTTRLEYVADIRLVELASGRSLEVLRVDERPRATASSDKGAPAKPEAGPLRQQVRDAALAKALRQLLPWEEVAQAVFFDDEKYHMEAAHKRLQAQDRAGAWREQREGAAFARVDAKGDPKYRARALHNLGVLAFQEGRLDEALAGFREARDLQPEASIYKDAIRDAERAKAVAAALDAFEAARTRRREPAPPRTGKAGVEERLEALDRMRQKGLITDADYQAKKAEILKEL